jgi:hypothetical protein
MEADSMEKHVERKLLVARLTQRFFKEQPGSKSVYIWGSDIVGFSPLLEDVGTFFVAVERVVDELAPGFEIVISEYRGGPDELICITMDDPKRLDRYMAEKEVELAEVRKETSRHAFTLDEEANLYLVDSELPPYSIERGSLRHKLVYYLAKHGGYMSAAQLAEKLDSNPKRIRTTVGQLRDKVEKQFDVSGTDLIQNRATGSYCASTVTLRVPKGYTP